MYYSIPFKICKTHSNIFQTKSLNKLKINLHMSHHLIRNFFWKFLPICLLFFGPYCYPVFCAFSSFSATLQQQLSTNTILNWQPYWKFPSRCEIAKILWITLANNKLSDYIIRKCSKFSLLGSKEILCIFCRTHRFLQLI